MEIEPGQDQVTEPSAAEQFAAHLDSDIAGNSQAATAEPAPAETQEPQATPNEEFHGHPAWKPFEEALGPVQYRVIEPHLRSMNQAFESKIAAQNKALESWKPFIDQQVDPAQLQQRLQAFADYENRLNNDPVGVYRDLEQYLRQTGQLEAAAQAGAAADAIEGAEAGAEDEDPRIAALQQQIQDLTQGQQQWLQFQQVQQQEAQFAQSVKAEESKLEQEVQALKTAGADDRMIAAVIDRAELLYYRTGKPTPLAEIHAALSQEQSFIRDQPRPVDRAPRLPGVSGGAPAPQTADLSKASRNESIDTLTALIKAHQS